LHERSNIAIKIELEVVKGAKAAKICLNRLPTIIGRSADAALTLPTTKVSRRHCEIYEDEGVFVRDLESTNGTLVNKHPISKATELHTGDLLRVGPILFRVTCPQQPESDESMIDLDADSSTSDGTTSESVVEHRETEDGSFVSIEDAKAVEDDAPYPQETVTNVDEDDLAGDDFVEPVEEVDEIDAAVAKASDDDMIFDEAPQKPVKSGDSALDAFFKNLD